MPANEYSFETQWRVHGSIEEVYEVVSDPTDLPRWWPAAYLRVEETVPGGTDGAGRQARLLTKGWLPYTLDWGLRTVETHRPRGFTIEAFGDFVGRGVWSFRQEGPEVAITFDWRIRTDKPLLRVFSPLLKPLFAFNHRWAMARGEESLKLELARRHATSEAARAVIPPPPPATTTSPVPLLLVTAAVIGGLAALVTLARRRR